MRAPRSRPHAVPGGTGQDTSDCKAEVGGAAAPGLAGPPHPGTGHPWSRLRAGLATRSGAGARARGDTVPPAPLAQGTGLPRGNALSAARPGPSAQLQSPQRGQGSSVPHVALLPTDGDNACPLVPCARRDHPWCRGQPGRSLAAAWGSPGQTQARYNEGQELCPHRAPPAALHPKPASRHLPDGTPQGLQDRGAGGDPAARAAWCLLGELGSRDGARGAPAGRGERGDRAPCAQRCPCPSSSR